MINSNYSYHHTNLIVKLLQLCIIIITLNLSNGLFESNNHNKNDIFNNIMITNDGTTNNIENEDSNNNNNVIKLSNGIEIPLIGLGLGNQDIEDIPTILSASISNKYNLGYKLFDTCKSSNNERLISEIISKEVLLSKDGNDHDHGNNNDKIIIHIITKVWYTYLGYERTKLSIKESIDDLLSSINGNNNIELRIHVLLHWPRCYNGVSWMNCNKEEEELSQFIKDIGSNPLLYSDDDNDNDNHNYEPWIGSWKALEEYYLKYYPLIASIGVSNFGYDDYTMLLRICNIKPHIVQCDIVTLYELWPIIKDTNVIPSVFHVFYSFTNNIITTTDSDSSTSSYSQQALDILLDVTQQHSNNNDHDIGPCTILLSYFMQKGIIIIPRTTSIQHLKQNSPNQNTILPLNSNQMSHLDEAIELLIKALLLQDQNKHNNNNNSLISSLLPSSKYLKPVTIIFYNALDVSIKIIWIASLYNIGYNDHNNNNYHNDYHTTTTTNNYEKQEENYYKDSDSDNERDVVIDIIYPYASDSISSHPGHRFVAYTMNDEEIGWYHVSSSRGDTQSFNVVRNGHDEL